jgi:hypothetical protein
MSVLDDLGSFYKLKGIAAAEPFRCECLNDCKRDLPKFDEAQEAFVGKNYDELRERNIPRLLFVSIDPGNSVNPGSSAAETRTSEAERWRVENEYDVHKYTNRHWSLTNRLAADLLGTYSTQLGRNITIDNSRDYFAHTRAAKCCMNNPESAQALKRLFDNCRKYLPEELSALGPDVIISQGDYGMDAVRSVLGDFDVERGRNYHADACLNGRRVIWLRQYHPRYGGFWKQKEEFWPIWQGIMREWKPPVPALAA